MGTISIDDITVCLAYSLTNKCDISTVSILWSRPGEQAVWY